MRNRNRYPKHWKRLRLDCLERANWRCEHCAVLQGTIRVSPWTGKSWPVYLQAAHVNHDPDNVSPELVCVCPRCHWRNYRRDGSMPQWYLEKIKHRKLIAQAYCY